jgi:peptidoglycan/LPS O-acetylase OafA/YrhL
MNRVTSTYLDMVRFIAALIVFLGHVGERAISGGFLWQFTVYGAPAVVVFFVLSGFVVGFVAQEKETAWRDYALARTTRLYSVVIPALVITAGLDWYGYRAAPEIYQPYILPLLETLKHYGFSLMFLNETRFGRLSPGSNGAYWSLGYEAVYYALFGVIFYARGWFRILVCAIIVSIVRTHVLLLFPLWGLGFVTYRICCLKRIGPVQGSSLFLGSLIFGLAYVSWLRSYGMLASLNALFDHDLNFIIQDFLLGAILAANLIGLHALSQHVPDWLLTPAPTIRWLAGASFTLYITHVPLLFFFKAVVPWSPESWEFRVTIILAPLFSAFIIAELSERRKKFWRRSILFAASMAQGILPPKVAQHNETP